MEPNVCGILWIVSISVLAYLLLTALRELIHEADSVRRDLALLYVAVIALPPLGVFARMLLGLAAPVSDSEWFMLLNLHALHLGICLVAIPVGNAFGWRTALLRLTCAGLPTLFLWVGTCRGSLD